MTIRKALIGWTIVASLIAFAVLSWFQPLDAAFLVSGQTAGPRDVDVFVQVDVPRDLSAVCSDSEASAFTCRMKSDLVDLNNPSVDAVLVKYHQVIFRNGVVIFDYRKANPRP